MEFTIPENEIRGKIIERCKYREDLWHVYYNDHGDKYFYDVHESTLEANFRLGKYARI